MDFSRLNCQAKQKEIDTVTFFVTIFQVSADGWMGK